MNKGINEPVAMDFTEETLLENIAITTKIEGNAEDQHIPSSTLVYSLATARNLNDIDKPFNIFYAIGTLVITVVGGLGNILVIGAVLTDRRLWKENNLFILNLAFCDFSVSIFVNPFNFSGIYVGHAWFMEHRVICHVSGAVCLICCTCSMWTIATISLNRFVLLCRQHYYHRIFTWRSCSLIILGIWVASVFLDLPNFFGWGDHSYDMKTMSCSYDRTADYSYTVFFIVVFITFPLLVVVYSNVNIYMFVLRSRKRVAAHQEGITGDVTSVSQSVKLDLPGRQPKPESSSGSHDALLVRKSPMVQLEIKVNKENYDSAPALTSYRIKQRNIWREVKLAKTLFIIFVLFCICWAPYAVTCLYDRYDHVAKDWYAMTIIFAHTSTMLNSILYAAMNKGIRNGYKTFLQKMGCKCFDKLK